MKTSMIIPCYLLDRSFFEMTETCLTTARKYGDIDEIIIVDDGSPYREFVFEDARIIRLQENRGYPVAVNVGLQAASGDILIVSNNDIVFTAHWLDELLEPLKRSYDISCIRASDSDGWTTEDKITEGDKFGSIWAIKRYAYEKLGGLDEQFGRGTFEDTDYRRRALRAGFRVGKNHRGLVIHHARATFDAVDPGHLYFRRNAELYRKKWGFIE